MTKTFDICGKTVVMKADGRLPILYRQNFPENNFFLDIMKLTRSRFDAEAIIRFAYTMAKAADPSLDGDMMAWLEGFDDPLAFYREGGPALDIARLVIGTTETEKSDDEKKQETEAKNGETGDR